MTLRNVVVISDHAYINGGQAKIAIDSAKSLALSGLNVIFFAPCGPPDPSLQDAGIRVICLDQDDILDEPNRVKAAKLGLWNTKAAKALRDLINTLNPQSSILHCHGFAKALSPSIGPVLTDGPLAHIFTMHEYFLACPNGAFFDFQRNQLCTRKALGPSCLVTHCDARRASHKAWRVARQVILWNLGRLPRNLKHVIYLSDLQHRLMKPYLDAGVQLYHVPNPIDFQGHKRVPVEDNNIALFIGRLTPEKGCTLFARAAKEAGVNAVFVGEGPEASSIIKANPEAIITGWLSSGEIGAWLEKSRYLVFPSLLYETFGLVAYEALAKGVPVICGDWTSASEIVEDNKTGWHVTSRNTGDWVAVLKHIKSKDITAISKNAHAIISEKFANHPAHHDTLIDLYEAILADHIPFNA